MIPGNGASLLCETDDARRRLVDMEQHMRPARVAVFATATASLLALAPWLGWWPLGPFAGAVLGFLLVDRLVPGSRRPEYLFMGAWAFAQLMIAIAVGLTGGPRSLFSAWLAIPIATLGARFERRGVVAGVVWTLLLLVAATVGVDAHAVATNPERLVVPTTLVLGVAILSLGLMRSDVEHRAATSIDVLTGLLNRHALARHAEELLEQTRVTQLPLALLIADVDGFKRINDEHGHLVGDAVLREVAKTLHASLRSLDHVFRYGGDEFVVLLPATEADEAGRVAERLRAAVAAARPHELPLTISVGVGTACAETRDLDDLVRTADRALYRAKDLGRDRVALAAGATR